MPQTLANEVQAEAEAPAPIEAFDPTNGCCNAPCPPGAGCNTVACTAQTKFYRRRWVCQWVKHEIKCGVFDAEKCGYVLAWKCDWREIPRAEVLAAFCNWRQAPRCPSPQGGECDCFVPPDQFFAQVFEISYETCSKLPHLTCESLDGIPKGCACCGVYETVKPRWVKINCKADIPASCAQPPAPVTLYEPAPDACGVDCVKVTGQGVGCKTGPAASPFLGRTLVF